MSRSLSTLLVETAEHYGDRPAFRSARGSLTYRRLLQHALVITNHLVSGGIRPGDRVAISLPKSPELPAAIFGTLLAGGCYVPLDYNAPRDRALSIIRDARPTALVCDKRVSMRLIGEQPPGESENLTLWIGFCG